MTKRRKAANADTIHEGRMEPEGPAPARRVTLNKSQQRALTAIRNNAVTVILGEAGGGKSFAAMYAAKEMLMNKEVEKVIVLRSPADICRFKLGHIPGDLASKLEPWAAASLSIAKSLRVDEKVEFFHIGHAQGITWSDCCIILEEAQSLTLPELEAIVTRLGIGSKIIATGDPNQDICRSGGILPFVHLVRNVPGVAIVEFDPEENQRHPVVRDIRKALYASRIRPSN